MEEANSRFELLEREDDIDLWLLRLLLKLLLSLRTYLEFSSLTTLSLREFPPKFWAKMVGILPYNSVKLGLLVGSTSNISSKNF